MRRLSIIAGFGSALLLAACGGGSTLTGLGGGSGGSSGSSGGGTVTVLSIGSGAAGAFQPGKLAIATASLSAGGSTSLQVNIVNQQGVAYTTATAVTFNSPCIAQGLASITGAGVASGTVTTSTGTATVTYVASGCSGPDVITATAVANAQNLTATGTVTVQQAAIGSIAFISATPPRITLKGVGSIGGSATSTLVFQVLDTSNGPRAGATVNFSLNTTVGGLSISPMSGTTDAQGHVQTIVSAGTVATTVRVTATTTTSTGTQISTQSNALTVSTGVPTSANISLAVQCHNVEAFDADGVSVPVTVRMTDRFSNPVPDGTTANFQTTLGGIDASCQTAGGNGTCTVNWVSKAPRQVFGNPQTTAATAGAGSPYCPTPAFLVGQNTCASTTNGRSHIMVTAIGEESFVDAVGNGYFNAGDTVPFNATDGDNVFLSGSMAGQPKAWFDTSEPFLNEWEIYDSFGTPTYVLGEPYVDFNSNGTRDGPDDLYQGALCQGSLCAPTASVAIYDDNVIVMSGSAPFFNPGSGSTISGGSTGTTFSVQISDARYQQMPAGTTVSATIAGSNATIVGPSSYTWPCSSAIGGATWSFAIQPPAAPTVFTPGSLILTVKTPGGITTIATYLLKS